jgi:hypothetical protein
MNQAFIYLPWMRAGLSGAIEPKDGAPGLTKRVVMNVNVTLDTPQSSQAQTTVRMYGPGDVIGFDAAQVIRTEPKHQAQNFEPNYFPFIEFDRPDFPWLFTPAAANAADQLRPWVCLVVVEQADGKLVPGQPLPLLNIDEVEAELPDLAESWAWAYTQVMDTTAISATLANRPAENLSRLVCPRKLEANKTYLACVVPAFKAGVLAGMGKPVEDNTLLEPAWTFPAPTPAVPLQLPVYYHWEFSTGPAGDFEALVWKLEQRDLYELADKIGHRSVQVPLVGEVSVEGALRVAPMPEATEQAAKQQMAAYAREIKNVLNAPEGLSITTSLGSLTVKPPLYGQWHAASHTLAPQPKTTPRWLCELNTDPRQRAVAALGTHIVQEQQESLMAAAWEQVEGIETANQLLRQAQLARASSKNTHARLSGLPASTLVQITAPMHARVSVGMNNQTAYAVLEKSNIPTSALSGAFRRAARERGPAARRLEGAHGRRLDSGSILERLNQKQIQAATREFALGEITSEDTQAYVDSPAAGLQADLSFLQCAREQHKGMLRPRASQPNREPLNLNQLGQNVAQGLDPEITIAARWRRRIDPRPKDWNPEDPLEPIMAAPEFPTPMYKPLAEISEEWLLPGVAAVPPNTISSLSTNPRFIRAFMVGLNHEMSRELLWREFPTDQRGTYFRQFWDPVGAVPRPVTDADRERLYDIDRITDWQRTLALDAEMGSAALAAKTVLLIRGELLGRYPNAIVSMAKAAWTQNGDPNGPWVRQVAPVPSAGHPGDADYPEKYPEFAGTLGPDITFMCFNVPPEEAYGDEAKPGEAGSAGWFFAIQQPPTEPRYGLDETLSTTPTAHWTAMDLAWPHVAKTKGNYISLSGGLNDFPAAVPITWGTGVTSADLACVTLQRPLRLAIHASDLLSDPKKVTS